jgi:O-antigen/teichoic acid export membrane protein
VGVPAVFGLSALAEPIMTVLTGAQFSGGYVIVPWVAAGAFFLGLQHRYNQVLRLVRRTRDIMLWILLAGGLNILLNWWLLPIFGYQMAAVTTFASYVALCAGQAWSSSRQFYWPFPWGTTLRSCVAAGIMFAGVWLLKNTLDLAPIVLLFVAMPAAMAIYGITLWALGEVSLVEARALQVAGKQWINGFGLVQRSKAD